MEKRRESLIKWAEGEYIQRSLLVPKVLDLS